jgi:hypothetical protein
MFLHLANLRGGHLTALCLELASPLFRLLLGRQDHLPQHVDHQGGEATGG